MKKDGGVIKNWQIHNTSFTKKQLDKVYPGENLQPMILTGTIEQDPTGRFTPGHHVRTSLIVKLDRKNKIVETRNTIYKLSGKEGKDVLPNLSDGVLGIFY